MEISCVIRGSWLGIPWQLCTILHISPKIGFQRETTAAAAHFYTFIYMDFFFLATHLKNDERPTQTGASDCSVRIRENRPAEKCTTPDQSPCLAFPLSGL